MKSATAQKMVLNMITTGANIRRGKVLENVMVDLQLSNKKLHERAHRIVMMFGDVDYEKAGEYLDAAGGHVKTALVMLMAGVDRNEAKKTLDENQGFIRRALQQLKG